MIVVKLMGGLGNQMFQYSIGRSLAYEKNEKLVLDTSFLSRNHKNTTPWPYKLYHLNINVDSISKSIFLYYGSLLVGKIVRAFPWIIKSYILERDLTYSPQVSQASQHNIYLNGYWQCEKYFNRHTDIIRSEFQVVTKQSDNNIHWSKLIAATQSICLHVRRGDYVTNAEANKVHGVLQGDDGLGYYQRAIKYISEHVESPVFYVFSDDMKWVKENLEIPFEMYYMDQNGPEEDYEDLRLMMGCKHFIIANSSFSWWGAWLGSYKDKIVVCPSKWFANPKMKTDIVCERWIRL